MGKASRRGSHRALLLHIKAIKFILAQRIDDQLSSLLPAEFVPAIPHLRPYLLASFGSFSRMDYGTGHETSFAVFLLCLTLIRFFEPIPDEERDLVLNVFVRYLKLCWRLQDVYRLEPAGSHGVWGLDDYSFLAYIFGSGQLRGSLLRPLLIRLIFTGPIFIQIKLKRRSHRVFIIRSLLTIFISCQSCVYIKLKPALFTNIHHSYTLLPWVFQIGARSTLGYSRCTR